MYLDYFYYVLNTLFHYIIHHARYEEKLHQYPYLHL
jgi:hypothetical protein